jgi:asparagine synthase (glutamine-hydrolysing)
MCGIAGVFGKADPATVAEMLRRIAYRGPDDEFLVSGPRFTLGARRLSIIDVEGGRQPLSNETGTVWAAQNGELYNFPELRPALETKGHRFRTRSDTEIIPHLYEDWGAEFPSRLLGMFGIAVWDDARECGLLARDHTGKKPIYYLERPGALYFASEIKCLLAVRDYQRRLNPSAIHHFLSYKHVPDPDTAFEGIKSLGPAQTLQWSARDGVKVSTYWAPSWAPDLAWDRMDEEEIALRVAASLKEGVRRRLLSDVPIGFYLSGGVDSSFSTALAATLSPGRIKTFTLTYDSESTTPGKDEDQRWARAVARQYGTEHHEERLSAGSFAEEFPKILNHFDQPFSGVVSPYFLSRLIGRHVRVALSGDGADELFGSYLSHRLAPVIAEYVERGASVLDRPSFRDNRKLVETIADRDPAKWRARLAVFSEAEKRDVYTRDFAAAVGAVSSDAHLAGYFARASATDPLNRILEAEFRGIFPDQVLAFVDRLSMAHSLETRTAYLDREFVELAASLPGRLKIRDGENKYILKRAAMPYLPAELISRPKEGFVMPVNQWLMSDSGGVTGRVLHPDRVRAAGMVRPEAVAALVARFQGGEASLANRVLSLIALHVWWEDYLGESRIY